MNKNVMIGGLAGAIVILLIIIAFVVGRQADDVDILLYGETQSGDVVDVQPGSAVQPPASPQQVSNGNHVAPSASTGQNTAQVVPAVSQPVAEPVQKRSVYFNGRELSEGDLASIEQRYGVAAQDGNYWYDSRSGAFGNMGGPALGVMYPGHAFGQVAANASNGNSGVYFNGRELTSEEAYLVAALFGYPAPTPGSYWLEANGNLGVDGYDVALGNVYAAIASSGGGGGGGDNIWSSGLYSGGNYYTGANGQPSQGYVSVPGYGPVGYGF